MSRKIEIIHMTIKETNEFYNPTKASNGGGYHHPYTQKESSNL